jgi:hypothetical protein
MTKMLVRHERWFVTLVIDAVLWRKLDNPWQKSTVIDYKVFLVYVAMLVRVQRFTLAGSTPSGSVKCFRISSHNNFFHWVWNHVWIMCFSIPFTTANGHVVPYNGPTLWHILVMIFFGAHGWPSSHTSMIWYMTWQVSTCVHPLFVFFDVEAEAYILQIRYLIS